MLCLVPVWTVYEHEFHDEFKFDFRKSFIWFEYHFNFSKFHVFIVHDSEFFDKNNLKHSHSSFLANDSILGGINAATS